MKNVKGKPQGKPLPRLIDAADFKQLAEILRIRSDVYPTNYLDLLLLENKNNKLSEILVLFQNYKAKNNDFKTVTRIKVHIRHRQRHDHWIFKISGEKEDPIVILKGLN